MKLLFPRDDIRLVVCDSALELGRMFLRPQEFYESPHFAGKIFDLPTFKRYYSKRYGRGRFTYYRDYQGYNIPGDVFHNWARGYAGWETPRESDLLSLLGPLPDKFYLIGAIEKDLSTISHEISHAFFHLDPWYRDVTTRTINRYDLRALRRALKKIMYRDKVLDDECVSYLLFEEPWLRRNRVKLTPLRPLQALLRAAYNDRALSLRPRDHW